MRILVIGATGVAGGAGIEACREAFGAQAHITAVWYGKPDDSLSVEGADLTLFGDISDPACIEQIKDDSGDQFDWCLYATALGDVGFPVDETSQAQIDASNRLSFDPILQLEQSLNLGAVIAYSTFYNLDHQKITYGAMGHSKGAIEDWACEAGPNRRCCIRAGAFRSASSQGIKLLVRRRAKELAQSKNALLKSFFADTKPSVAVDALEKAVFDEERQRYGDAETDAAGLKAAHLAFFNGSEAPFVNVVGQVLWESEQAQAVGQTAPDGP